MRAQDAPVSIFMLQASIPPEKCEERCREGNAMHDGLHNCLEERRKAIESALTTLNGIEEHIQIDLIASNSENEDTQVEMPLSFFRDLAHDMRACFDELQFLMVIAHELGIDEDGHFD